MTNCFICYIPYSNPLPCFIIINTLMFLQVYMTQRIKLIYLILQIDHREKTKTIECIKI